MNPINFKHLILHPGSPKTGTTTLQNLLFRHRSELLSMGYPYPTTATPTSGGTALGHHHLALLLDSLEGPNLSAIEQLMDSLRTEIAQSPDAALIL